MNVSDYALPEAPCSSPFLSGLSLTDVCTGDVATLFLSMVNVLAAYSPIINGVCERIEPIKKPQFIYDFIVVGGGAAGSVVASRLSEINNWHVLLIEAGPDEPAGMQIPSNLQLYLNTDLDWKYQTSNESFACLKKKGCYWPRGKNLGGCTSHHGMAYHRGHAKDYNRWVEMGNKGWSWSEVLPYFWKSEDNKEIGRVRAEDHVTGGPMTVTRFRWQPQFAWDVLTAAEEVGLGISEDLVGSNITGFTVAQTISRNGVRLSAARAYLWPNKDRKNLHVALNATVTKVITRKPLLSKVRAEGVTFIMNNKPYDVWARKEVILTAGAINSPQLLLLSGIGPKKHLDSMKIRTVLDLPGVGENLHNHASYGMDFTLNETDMNELNIDSANMYFYNQSGPMSSTGMAQVTGILASNYTTADDPDIQIFFAGYQAICNTGGRIADLKAYDNKRTVRFTAVNLRTLSRGRITLASNNPLEHPIIWSNDLAHPQDRSIIYQGIQNILKLSKAKTLKKYGLNMIDETISECKQYKKDKSMDYLYWDCQFRYDTRPENHQAGTCKMGPSSDSMAVVSPKLKVHGIDRLRVADASIMPWMISGNPVAAINMIGERVADFIKHEYGQKVDNN